MNADAPSRSSPAPNSRPGQYATAVRRLLSAPLGGWAKGIATALVSFGLLGTVAALWENPLFVRMTPAGGWEIGLLAILSILTGVYVAIRRTACGTRRAGAGGVIGFLGIACPVCNKVLLYLFGGELLLTYFEPVRIYVAAAGTVLVMAAIAAEWRRRSHSTPPAPLTPAVQPNA